MSILQTKIFLCVRDNELRLSIMVDGNERLFVRNTDEKQFLDAVKKGISDREIMDFPTIQNMVRCSKTMNFSITSDGCESAPEHIKQNVRRIFNEVSEPITV